MATKTFKIGEYCKGGIITVEIKGKVISVIGKEWDYSKGSRKSSNQSNAKEWCRGTVLATDSGRCLQALIKIWYLAFSGLISGSSRACINRI